MVKWSVHWAMQYSPQCSQVQILQQVTSCSTGCIRGRPVCTLKADSQCQKRSDQRPTTAPRPSTCRGGVAGGRRDQNAKVEHGSTSATSDWVAGPVSIEM